MQLKNKYWSIFLIFFIGLLFINSAAPKREVQNYVEVPLSQVISAFNFSIYTDPILDSIRLGKNNRYVTIIPSRKRIICGNRIVLAGCRENLNGEIFLTRSGLDNILYYLLRKRINWYLEDGNLIVGNKKINRIGEKTNFSNRKDKSTNYRAVIKSVVIDPGHGGKDPGGIGYRGIKEKDIVLKIAKYVNKYLSMKRKDIKIIMTRNKDEFISLEKRAEIANNLKDAIYVSIHANVSYNKKSIGYESYYLTIDPQDDIAREVAEKENSVINYESVKNKRYLLKIINHIVDLEYRRESIKLADSVQKGIKKSIGDLSIDRGVKSAYFYVLKAVKMPSVLIEVGFVTNGVEATHLTNSDYQKKLANGIANGIDNFIKAFEDTNGFTKKK